MRKVLEDEQMGAIGQLMLGAGKEKHCLIRAKGDALVLETLFVAEDVYSQAEIEEAAEEAGVPKKAVARPREAARRLAVGRPSTRREQLTSEYPKDLKAMLEAKLDGQPLAEPEPVTRTRR